MKKLFLTTLILFAANAFFGQIKIWPSGYVGIGYTATAPTSGFVAQISGKTLFTSGTATVSSGGAQITGTNTTTGAGNPDYTWNGDPNTGFFHPLADVIGFSTNGIERARFKSNGQFLMTALSSATTPEYSWKGDSTTGIFRQAANTIGFSVGGAEKMRLSSAGKLLMLNSTSTYSVPDFSWSGDNTTGICHPASNEIALSTAGSDRVHLTPYELDLKNLSYGLRITAAGTWPNTQIIVPSATYTNAAAVYGYVMTYGTTDNFYVLATGDLWAKNTWYGSDSSIKRNVVTIPGALAKINKLRGVNYKYNYKDASLNDPNEIAMGVVAQEVERVIPEVVKTNKDGIKGVSYQSLIGLLIEGIKEQNKRVDSLQQQLKVCCSPKTGQRNGNGTFVSPQQDSINKNLQQQINNCCSKNPQGSGGSTISTAVLHQNIPNPFNQTTSIKCFIPLSSKTFSLLVFDMNGTLKKTIPISGTGDQVLTINGKELIAGMYYYTLIIDGNEIDTKKMILTEQ